MMNVVSMWRNRTPIRRFAHQEWIDRISQPKSTSVMIRCTLSNAESDARRIEEAQQDPRDQLDHEEEERHPAQEVADRLAGGSGPSSSSRAPGSNRARAGRRRTRGCRAAARAPPSRLNRGRQRFPPGRACRAASPGTSRAAAAADPTRCVRSGRTTPLWQPQKMSPRSARCWTVQSTWVQTALNARTSPSGVLTTRQGLPPKLNGAGHLPSASGRSSFALNGATASRLPPPPVCAGLRNRATG